MHDADILFKAASDTSSPTKGGAKLDDSIEGMQSYRDTKGNVVSSFTYSRTSDVVKTRKSDGLVYHKQGQSEGENALQLEAQTESAESSPSPSAADAQSQQQRQSLLKQAAHA